MGSSGAQPVTQQTQQTRDPWVTSQPALTAAVQGAQNLYANQQGYTPYGGATQADLHPETQYGLNTMAQLANQNLGGTAGNLAAQNLATNMIQSQGLSPQLQSLLQQQQGQNNPYLQSILDTQGRRIGDRVNSSMSGAGRYGSGAHTDVMTRALAESADPILAQDYTQRQQMQQGILEGGLQRAGQWAQLQPSLEAAQYAPAQMALGVGSYMDTRSQQALNDQIKLYNAQQAYPWEQLSRLSAIGGQAGALGGTQFTTSPIQQPSSLQKLLGCATAGAGIGGSFGGPMGAGVGALGGGLLSML